MHTGVAITHDSCQVNAGLRSCVFPGYFVREFYHSSLLTLYPMTLHISEQCGEKRRRIYGIGGCEMVRI